MSTYLKIEEKCILLKQSNTELLRKLHKYIYAAQYDVVQKSPIQILGKRLGKILNDGKQDIQNSRYLSCIKKSTEVNYM